MKHASTQRLSLSSKNWYRYRYAIVLLLLLTVAIFGWTGLRVLRAWEQAREVLAIRTIEDCQVVYDGETFSAERHRASSAPPPETIPESLLGKDLFHRAGTVRLPADRVDEALPHLKRLPYLRLVVVARSNSKSKNDVEFAVKRIGEEIPGLENIMVEMDLNAARVSQTSGMQVQQASDSLSNTDLWIALLLTLFFYWW